MAFASIYVSNFIVQSVVRANPDLRDRMLALVDGDPPLWKVIAANESALQAGIELGMGGSQAKQFSKVEVRQRSRSQEKTAHAALLDVGWSVSPRVEDTSLDTIVLDITGLTSLFGSVQNLSTTLTERTASIGLHSNIAVASNMEAAIHAARGFAGITLIPLGEESKRLSSLPVEVLLPSIGILETLHRWGIRTCGALAELPLLQLSERLGQEGIRLHELARGTFCRSLILMNPETSFQEEMALDYAVTELEPLSFLLGRLLDQLCARLEARSLAASVFCMQFDIQDATEEEFQIQRKTSNSANDFRIYEKILRLPVPMRDSKTLLKLLRLQLQSDPPHGSIVKLFLTAEPARPRASQNGLFIPNSPDPEKLEVTIARLAALVGDSNVGSPRLINTHRPGEFRMTPFFPATAESILSRKFSSSEQVLASSEIQSRKIRNAIAFRIFRPEILANVDSQEGCPCRIYFLGMCGEVIAASGPWRTSGDWWEESGWQQDEWDIEIDFNPSSHEHASRSIMQNGLYRIYYDWTRRRWFVRGRYD
ncbi:MAG TPA: DNA polymerase Y family protein [Candidatus Acidoferrales bacterium]|nr:DNA polymerase Y family protein [Candidatus Acidoferrales bacterium]